MAVSHNQSNLITPEEWSPMRGLQSSTQQHQYQQIFLPTVLLLVLKQTHPNLPTLQHLTTSPIHCMLQQSTGASGSNSEPCTARFWPRHQRDTLFTETCKQQYNSATSNKTSWKIPKIPLPIDPVHHQSYVAAGCPCYDVSKLSGQSQGGYNVGQLAMS